MNKTCSGCGRQWVGLGLPLRLMTEGEREQARIGNYLALTDKSCCPGGPYFEPLTPPAPSSLAERPAPAPGATADGSDLDFWSIVNAEVEARCSLTFKESARLREENAKLAEETKTLAHDRWLEHDRADKAEKALATLRVAVKHGTAELRRTCALVGPYFWDSVANTVRALERSAHVKARSEDVEAERKRLEEQVASLTARLRDAEERGVRSGRKLGVLAARDVAVAMLERLDRKGTADLVKRALTQLAGDMT